MTSIRMTSDIDVRLVDHMGSDDSIVRAMLVSTQGDDSLEAEATKGRINFLMANRHGTPFEHAAMTFYIKAPIFVFREFHRHRIGWSYNEESGRYKQLEPDFYVVDEDRPVKQVGKTGHYTYIPDSHLRNQTAVNHRYVYETAYAVYEQLLVNGVAKEVARMCLPVGIYSSMYATCNPRSLMAFLSLRNRWAPEDNDTVAEPKFPSFPMREIELVAIEMFDIFRDLFPITAQCYEENGFVAP